MSNDGAIHREFDARQKRRMTAEERKKLGELTDKRTAATISKLETVLYGTVETSRLLVNATANNLKRTGFNLLVEGKKMEGKELVELNKDLDTLAKVLPVVEGRMKNLFAGVPVSLLEESQAVKKYNLIATLRNSDSGFVVNLDDCSVEEMEKMIAYDRARTREKNAKAKKQPTENIPVLVSKGDIIAWYDGKKTIKANRKTPIEYVTAHVAQALEFGFDETMFENMPVALRKETIMAVRWANREGIEADHTNVLELYRASKPPTVPTASKARGAPRKPTGPRKNLLERADYPKLWTLVVTQRPKDDTVRDAEKLKGLTAEEKLMFVYIDILKGFKRKAENTLNGTSLEDKKEPLRKKLQILDGLKTEVEKVQEKNAQPREAGAEKVVPTKNQMTTICKFVFKELKVVLQKSRSRSKLSTVALKEVTTGDKQPMGMTGGAAPGKQPEGAASGKQSMDMTGGAASGQQPEGSASGKQPVNTAMSSASGMPADDMLVDGEWVEMQDCWADQLVSGEDSDQDKGLGKAYNISTPTRNSPVPRRGLRPRT